MIKIGDKIDDRYRIVSRIATGGMALLVRDDAPEINVLDGLLTLKGLSLIYAKNKQGV